jgi:acetyl esterase
MKIRHALALVTLLWSPALLAAGEPSEVGPTLHAYKTVGDAELVLHVFAPGGDLDSPRPAMLVFHGGGWSMGEAAWGYGRARHYTELGLVGISVQYRLSDQRTVTLLDAMADARDAFRWVREHAGELGVDPERVGGYGWSAGGHLLASAALFGTGGTGSTPAGPSSRPDLMVLVSPAVAVTEDGWFERLLLGRAEPASVSPDRHVRPGMPPAIVLQGETDTVTPTPRVRRFCERMKAEGNTCELVVYPGVGHLFTPSSEPDHQQPNPDPEVTEMATARADAFLREHGFGSRAGRPSVDRQLSSSSRSSTVSLRNAAPLSASTASASSRLLFWSSRIFSSTVSRAIRR